MPNGNTVATIDVTFSNDSNLNADFGTVTEVEKDYSSTIIADLYSAEKPYAVGDYVIHSKLLYRCITAIAEGEEWDSDKWTQIKLADDVEGINNALDNKLDKNKLTAGQGISVADVKGNKRVNNTAGIYTVKSTNVTSSTMGRWTGNIDIPDLYNGLTIQYLTTRHTLLDGVGAEDNCMLNLTFPDGSESMFVDIMFDSHTFVKEEYQLDECITMTYFDPQHSPTGQDVWLVQRPTVTQPLTNENKALSVLLSETPSDGSKATNCGAKRSNKLRFNPDTGDLTVPTINGKSITTMDNDIIKLKDQSVEGAPYHLGFYLDENGGLCQVNSL